MSLRAPSHTWKEVAASKPEGGPTGWWAGAYARAAHTYRDTNANMIRVHLELVPGGQGTPRLLGDQVVWSMSGLSENS